MRIEVPENIREIIDKRQKVKYEAIRKEPMYQREVVIPGRDCNIRCLEFVPKNCKEKEKLPVLFDIHGGGFTNGYPEEDDYICRRLADQLNIRVFSIDYRLAPDHAFPEGQLDCYDVVKYIHEHAEEFGVDTEKMVIQGHSAGGNFTVVTVIRAIETGEFSFVGQILDYAPLDFLTDPEDKFWIEGAVPPHLVKAFDQCYALPESRNDYHVSPYYVPDEIIRRMPSTVVISCEFDSLRDEEENFAAKLIRNGIEVTAKRIQGAAHAVSIVYDDPKSLETYQLMEEGIRKFISREKNETLKEENETKVYTQFA